MLSLTQLRQNLFALADQVIESGQALIVERRGVHLRLSVAETSPSGGRLSRLKHQDLVVGPALSASESPAAWGEFQSVKQWTGVSDVPAALLGVRGSRQKINPTSEPRKQKFSPNNFEPGKAAVSTRRKKKPQ
jgi:hypothetical protein